MTTSSCVRTVGSSRSYREPDAWEALDIGDMSDLARNVAGLPAAIDAEPEETKRFDLLALRLELALLRTEPGFPRLQKQVQGIASLLEDYPTIPAVARELALIADVHTDEWWTDVTLPMLETDAAAPPRAGAVHRAGQAHHRVLGLCRHDR